MTATKTKAETSKEPEDKVVRVEDLVPVYALIEKVARSTVALVDIAVQRGAIKGEELTTIGGLRDNSIRLIQEYENFHSSLEES